MQKGEDRMDPTFRVTRQQLCNAMEAVPPCGLRSASLRTALQELADRELAASQAAAVFLATVSEVCGDNEVLVLSRFREGVSILRHGMSSEMFKPSWRLIELLSEEAEALAVLAEVERLRRFDPPQIRRKLLDVYRTGGRKLCPTVTPAELRLVAQQVERYWPHGRRPDADVGVFVWHAATTALAPDGFPDARAALRESEVRDLLSHFFGVLVHEGALGHAHFECCIEALQS
jgi:hypothetical protein